jgi:hypothetical protein
MPKQKKVRHVLGISGGKDSTALAIYMRDKVPEIEYFFCDTGSELPETYDYLHLLEKYLGKPIIRLGEPEKNGEKYFNYWLDMNGNFLPSSRQRWCTVVLKIKPIEEFIGSDKTISYVAIRADEDSRKGYIKPPKGNIEVVYPFIKAGVVKAGVYKILENAGMGLPKYYEWRTRSGCYFCFFQRKFEWVGLMEKHPDLFKKAMQYEKYDPKTGKKFTWSQEESLEELSRPERVSEIKAWHMKQMEKEKAQKKEKPLHEVFEKALDSEDDDIPCLVCNL